MAANPFKYRYSIDSRLRTSGTDSDFTFPVKLPPSMSDMDKQGLHVVVLSCNIPKSYYIIGDGANLFTYTEGANTMTIKVNPGNWNALSYMKAVLAMLNAQTQNGSVYSCTFGGGAQNDGKYRWSVVGPDPVTFRMPAATGSGIYEQMGTVAGATYTLPFTSPNVVSFITQGTIQIHSDLVSANTDILAIAVGATNADYTSIVVQNADIDTRARPISESNSNSRHFYITDEFGEAIDLNGCPMFMEIMIYRPFQFTTLQYFRLRSHGAEEELLESMVQLLQEMIQLQKKKAHDDARARQQQLSLQTATAPPPPPEPATSLGPPPVGVVKK